MQNSYYGVDYDLLDLSRAARLFQMGAENGAMSFKRLPWSIKEIIYRMHEEEQLIDEASRRYLALREAGALPEECIFGDDDLDFVFYQEVADAYRDTGSWMKAVILASRDLREQI